MKSATRVTRSDYHNYAWNLGGDGLLSSDVL